MLRFRRIVEFSTRVHNYLFVLYLLFVAIFVISFYFPIDNGYVVFITQMLSVLGWTIIFEGLWIVLASLYLFLYTKVLPSGPLFLTIGRVLLYLLVAAGVDLFTSIVFEGLSI